MSYTPLPVPDFFDPSKVGDLWLVPYETRFAEALAWRQRHRIPTAATARFKIAAVGIDEQLTFIHPTAQLLVEGALDDSVRWCEWIYKNLQHITFITKTLDTHTVWQIFHSIFLVDGNGNHPTPGVPVPDEDIQSGKWQVNPEAVYAISGNPSTASYFAAYLRHYSTELARSKEQYPLIPWPFHALLGGIEHALVPLIHEASFFFDVCRGTQTKHLIKGVHPLTEAYGPLYPEVRKDHNGVPVGHTNTDFLDLLLRFDAIVVSGQAKSHCLRAFVSQLLEMISTRDPSLAQKIYLMTDTTSPVIVRDPTGNVVINFTQEADEAFDRFAAAGIHLVNSITPMDDWPGLEGKLGD